MDRSFWRGKRVFLTGHTGFKGSWLALWLADMGVEVHGYALAPSTTNSFFVSCDIEARMSSSVIADIRDADALATAMRAAKPQFVLHLAAQSLVRRSYDAPTETFAAMQTREFRAMMASDPNHPTQQGN